MTGADTSKSQKISRWAFPLLLLFAPLLSYPLVWKKLFFSRLPLWGDVQLFTPAVLGLLAGAAVCFKAEKLASIWKINRLRWLLIFAAAGIITAVIQQLIYGGTAVFLCSALFFFLVPLAGMLYSGELKRLFPLLGQILFLPVLAVTVCSQDFSGWMGNWNWNFTLLAMTGTSIFLLFPHLSLQRTVMCSMAAVILELVIFTAVKPELLPRGTFAGITGAVIILLCFRNISPYRRWAFALWAVIITLVLFTGSAGSIIEQTPDSRIQLWRGSLDFTLAHLPFGAGPDRFESMINPYLPEIYYFTPFAAARHTHPHNEFLNFAAGYGVAGVVFSALLVFAFIRGIRFSNRPGLWLSWCVLLLGIHGQFDVLLSLPLTGSWFLLGAGVVAANGTAKYAEILRTPLPRAAGWLFLVFAVLLAFATLHSSFNLREARLALSRKDPSTAAIRLKQSLRYRTTGENLYTAGAVELFDFRNPDNAIRHLEKIRIIHGLPAVYHSNALLGRAFAIKGDLNKSLYYFDEELKYYPYSAVASWLKLSVLRQAGADSQSIADENSRFEKLMKMRDMAPADISKLIRNQELDDAPLKNRKKL